LDAEITLVLSPPPPPLFETRGRASVFQASNFYVPPFLFRSVLFC
jgi:hypothetical protein